MPRECLGCAKITIIHAYGLCNSCYVRKRYNSEPVFRERRLKETSQRTEKMRHDDPFLFTSKRAIYQKRNTSKRRSKYIISNDAVEKLADKARNTPNCPYCNISLIYTGVPIERREQFGILRHNVATLDRINNGDIINVDTCQWTCFFCNHAKSNCTDEEYRQAIQRFTHQKV